MCVTVLEALRRVVLIPVGGNFPLIAAVQAVKFSTVMGVAVADSSGS